MVSKYAVEVNKVCPIKDGKVGFQLSFKNLGHKIKTTVQYMRKWVLKMDKPLSLTNCAFVSCLVIVVLHNTLMYTV